MSYPSQMSDRWLMHLLLLQIQKNLLPKPHLSGNLLLLFFTSAFSSSDISVAFPSLPVVFVENSTYCIFFCAASSSDTFVSTSAVMAVSIFFWRSEVPVLFFTVFSSPDTVSFAALSFAVSKFLRSILDVFSSSSLSETFYNHPCAHPEYTFLPENPMIESL